MRKGELPRPPCPSCGNARVQAHGAERSGLRKWRCSACHHPFIAGKALARYEPAVYVSRPKPRNYGPKGLGTLGLRNHASGLPGATVRASCGHKHFRLSDCDDTHERDGKRWWWETCQECGDRREVPARFAVTDEDHVGIKIEPYRFGVHVGSVGGDFL